MTKATRSKTTGAVPSDLRGRLLHALGHSVSSPVTQRAVAAINADVAKGGRRGATVRIIGHESQ
jgi:hypothetical protein